jgi:hypothetical protein
MGRWRPLAALAAVCVAATALLALTAGSGVSAVADTQTIVHPLSVTPDCGAVSAQVGVDVRLVASGLAPGANPISIGDQGPGHNQETRLGSATVSSSGTLDQTVTLPPQAYSGIFRIYVGTGDRYAFGYFSAPCPTVSVQPTCGAADDGSGTRYALTVSGTGYGAPPPATANPLSAQAAFGFGALPVHIQLDGVEVPGSPATPAADGTFAVLVTPARVKAGPHVIRAYVTTADAPKPLAAVNTTRESTTQFTVPCPNTQTTPTTPTTAPTTPTTAPTTATTAPTTPTTEATTTTQTTTTTTAPTGTATIQVAPTCLEPAASGTSRVQVSGGGFAAGSLDVLVDGSVATHASAGSDGSVSAEVEITAGSADHAIELRQGSRRADATLGVPCASHPKLKVDPPLGQPGFVTKAIGSGFPPNVQVRLTWQPGIGTQTVQTDGTGSFSVSVLVFPQDQTGPRVLRATPVSAGRFVKVDAKFLCVPGSVQRPSTFDFRR